MGKIEKKYIEPSWEVKQAIFDYKELIKVWLLWFYPRSYAELVDNLIEYRKTQ